MIAWLTSLPRRSLIAVKAHPVLTTLFALASIAWLGFGVLIGGIPFFGITWLAVLGGSWLVLTWRTHRRARREADAELVPATTNAAKDSAVIIGVVAVVALVLFGVIQLIPYGHPQKYAAGSGEPAWATPQTRQLMVSACFDCHSNEVTYPWYSNIAPVSWTVQHHIDEGRGAVNYSDFATNPRGGRETIEVIREGSMPPGYFTAFGMHPEAKLTDAQRAELIAGLEATPGFQGGGRAERDDHDR